MNELINFLINKKLKKLNHGTEYSVIGGNTSEEVNTLHKRISLLEKAGWAFCMLEVGNGNDLGTHYQLFMRHRTWMNMATT